MKWISIFPPWKLRVNILQNQISNDGENGIFTINMLKNTYVKH